MTKRPDPQPHLQKEIYAKLQILAQGNSSRIKLLFFEDEAAEFLRVSRFTLEKWRIQGRGPKFCNFGEAIRYDYADLVDYINASKFSSTSQRTPYAPR